MATIKPFKAVRPTRDKVSWVSCKALSSYTEKNVTSKLDYNPFTFLHVVNPVYKYLSEEVPVDKRFEFVKNRYQEFKDDQVLFKEENECLYVYKKITPSKKVYCGIIAATAIEDYKSNNIRKHEATLVEREELFEDYLKNTGFNAEPVLLTYPDNDVIANIMEEVTKTRAEYEFSTQDKNLHLMWLIDDTATIKKVQEQFKCIDSLIIADGHHRTSASLLLAEHLSAKNPKSKGTESYNFFMSYLLPESNLNISSFNRFIKDLNGYTTETFLEELGKIFKIENYGDKLYVPQNKYCFSMYMDGQFYALELRNTHANTKDKLSSLDSEILYCKVLQELLGIKDIRYDKRIHYAANINDPLALKTKVDDGKFVVSFGMKPVTIAEIKMVTDQGQTLLPKTTYVEPKIRSAMTIYEW